MGFGTVLTVLVFAVSGPPGSPPPSEPDPNGTIRITRPVGAMPVASSDVGNLTVSLRPGWYTIQALGLSCTSAYIKVNSHRRRGAARTVRLYCKAS
jgi:hypothetical protein